MGIQNIICLLLGLIISLPCFALLGVYIPLLPPTEQMIRLDAELHRVNPTLPVRPLYSSNARNLFKAGVFISYIDGVPKNDIIVFHRQFLYHLSDEHLIVVLAHEYGHIVAGHIAQKRPSNAEEQADKAGMNLIRKTRYNPCAMSFGLGKREVKRIKKIQQTCRRR